MWLIVLIAGGWLAQIAAWLVAIARLRSQAAAQHEWLRELALRLVMIALIAWAVLAARDSALAARLSPALRAGAVFSFVAGHTIAIAGRVQLGGRWSIGVHARGTRVAAGIYRYLPHPIYSGVTLALVAQCVLLQNLPSLLLLAGALVITPVKARLESRALRALERHDQR